MNYVDCGVYEQHDFEMPSNSPADGGAYNAYIIVLKPRTSSRLQIWMSVNAGKIYYRTTNEWSGSGSTQWSSWKAISAS